MILYAESSAVLSWLFGEDRGEVVRAALAGARRAIASDLTWLECHRALSRYVATGSLREADAATLRARLSRDTARWTRLSIAQDVVSRAGLPFPGEPIRALDAVHLASELLVKAVQPDVRLLSLDGRVRRCAAGLGFDVLPAQSE